jgi:hypothetical protein
VRYDPALPFGGYGSPCGNLALQRRRAEMHAEDSRNLPAVAVDFPDLADCQECDMCGGCETHGNCATDWNHLTWFMEFASPGEKTCRAAGGPAGRTGHACALPWPHNGWHRDKRGNGWPA